jgi:hypothetical protein
LLQLWPFDSCERKIPFALAVSLTDFVTPGLAKKEST